MSKLSSKAKPYYSARIFMRKVIFAPGNIYHIYNRGVEKRDIFMSDGDRWRFLQGIFLFNDVDTSSNLLWELEKSQKGANFKTLKEYFFVKEKRSRNPIVRIMADCLMSNHYHLLVEELQENGITKFMHRLGTGYTMYFNKKYHRVGSLFQGPFKAKLVDQQPYVEYLLAYINVLNPGQLLEPNLKEEGVKDMEKVIHFAKSYPWSTQKEYLHLRDSIIIDKGILGEVFPNGQLYENFIKSILRRNQLVTISHLLFE